MMKLYMAPMEALTGYIYRNTFRGYFGGIDRYFTPFIASKKLNSKEKNDVLPEHNEGIDVVPQILTNKAMEFVYIANHLKDNYGYETVNLNLGCPAGTVAAKHRGAGFLAVPDELKYFLDEIYTHSRVKISIKTRLGIESPEECAPLMELYNDYPLEELIIHARFQKDFYTGSPRMDSFDEAVRITRHNICYNGDINSVEDYNSFTAKHPDIDRIMLGRGLIAAPGLAREIKNNTRADRDTLRAFHDDLFEQYKETMSGERNTMYKMKELWVFFCRSFSQPEECMKLIKRCEGYTQYTIAVNNIFRNY